MLSDQRQQRWRLAPVIRLGLHPVDMRHRFSRDYWLHTLQQLLADGRVPMSKINWLAQQRGQLEHVA
jgi:predicted deacetylase